jgi:uncharacterized protein
MYFTMTLILSLPVAPPPRLLGEFVELRIDAGTLHGTIDLPERPGPWPVVLLHPGSGPTDRDGNNLLMRNESLKLLGRALAAEGFAVLRIDKRGIGASANAMSKEEDVRIDSYVADAVAWTAFLRKDGRFTKVGFIGHSEGALVCLVAAQEAKPDALVSLCGPGRPFAEVIREQLKTALPKDLLEDSDKILAELEAGRTVKEVPDKLRALYRPSIQPYLLSLLKHDPAKLAAGYSGPLFVVTGSTDIQIPVSDGQRLTKHNARARHVTIEGMNHILKRVEKKDRVVQIPTYMDSSLPLHPKLAPELAAFLRDSLGGKQPAP